jgi:hypothetical protein
MENTNTQNPSLQKWLLSFISEQKKEFLISDQQVEEKDAFFHYNKGDFSIAAKNFLKLLSSSPEEKKYWLYFALSLQNEKQYAFRRERFNVESSKNPFISGWVSFINFLI